MVCRARRACTVCTERGVAADRLHCTPTRVYAGWSSIKAARHFKLLYPMLLAQLASAAACALMPVSALEPALVVHRWKCCSGTLPASTWQPRTAPTVQSGEHVMLQCIVPGNQLWRMRQCVRPDFRLPAAAGSPAMPLIIASASVRWLPCSCVPHICLGITSPPQGPV